MKKVLLLLMSSFIVTMMGQACKPYDDTDLRDHINDVEKYLSKVEKKVNEQIETIDKLAGASSIKSVAKIDGGCCITFDDNTTSNLVSGANGKDADDGNAPVIGVKSVAGVLCWTINGELAKDEAGNNVACQRDEFGAPKVKYEDEEWYITYDDGSHWLHIDKGEYNATVAFEETEDAYIFIVDGERIPIAKSTSFRLRLQTDKVSISSTDVIEIPYVLTGSDETVHFVFQSENYVGRVDADRQVIIITAPGSLDPGVMVVKVIRNSDGAYAAQYIEISGTGEITIVTDYFELGCEGGQVEIPIVTDLNFEVSSNADWLQHIQTKAVTNRTVVMEAARNTRFVDRTATVTVKSVAGHVLTAVVHQERYDDGVTIGVKGRPYVLSSLEDLKTILRNNRIKNSDYPVEFVLTADIDMTGEDWTPLDLDATFPIHFDGQGHTIYNFSQLQADSSTGFFGFLVGGVENLTFENANVFAKGQKGGVVAATLGIAGWTHTDYQGSLDHPGTMINVHVKNSVVTHEASNYWLGWSGQCGGLVGEAYVPGTAIKRCSVENTTIGGQFCAGGLVGQVNYGAVVEECLVRNVVVNVSDIVPVAGSDNSSWNNKHWVDPYKLIPLGKTIALGYAGGITGILNEGTIRNCMVTGEGGSVYSESADRQCAGGIVGCQVVNSTVEYCWNEAYVGATADSPEDNTDRRAGGIVGGTSPWVSGGNVLRNCINWGDVTGAAGGGICGYISVPTEGYTENEYGLNYVRDSYTLSVGFGFPPGSYGDPETRIGKITGTDPHDTGICFFFHGVKTGDWKAAAESLGWDPLIWNLSGSTPKLAWEE